MVEDGKAQDLIAVLNNKQSKNLIEIPEYLKNKPDEVKSNYIKEYASMKMVLISLLHVKQFRSIKKCNAAEYPKYTQINLRVRCLTKATTPNQRGCTESV